MIRISILILLTAGCLSTALPAQLAGFYTIDAATPATLTNFTSTASAAAALAAQGVSGWVTFLIVRQPAVPGCPNPPYGAFALSSIAGTSPTNTITFRGIGGYPAIQGTLPVLANQGFPCSIRLAGAGVTLGLAGVGPTDIVLEHLDVSAGSGGVAIGVSFCNRITLRDCKVHHSDCGIWIDNTIDALVEDNEAHDLSPVNPPPPTIYVPDTAAIAVTSSSHQAVVRRNRVHDCTHRGIAVGGTCPPLIGPFGGNDVRCVNNFIWNVTGLPQYTTGFPGGGIVVGLLGSGGLVANNSIAIIPDPNPLVEGPGIHLWLAPTPGAPPHQILNNVVLQQGSLQPCIEHVGPIGTCAWALPQVLDYNLYDAQGGGPIAVLNGIPYSPLPIWQGFVAPLEANSLAMASGFVSPFDLHLSAGAKQAGFPLPTWVVGDIDGNTRSATAPHRGADEEALALVMSQQTGPLSACLGPTAGNVSLDNYGLVPGTTYYNFFVPGPCPPIPAGGAPFQFVNCLPVNQYYWFPLPVPVANTTGHQVFWSGVLPAAAQWEGICFEPQTLALSPVAKITVR